MNQPNLHSQKTNTQKTHKKQPRQESRPPECILQGEQGAIFALIALEKSGIKKVTAKKGEHSLQKIEQLTAKESS